MFDAMPKVETKIVGTLSEAVYLLIREYFDLFVVEGESALAIAFVNRELAEGRRDPPTGQH